jgi:ADP-ribosyl-[dinitrogen reductase] hydrolase
MPGEWTDDTGMMLCVAEGILAAPNDPIEAIGARFLEWSRTAKDIGTTISATLGGYRGNWAEASRNNPRAQMGRAASNGSLMRTLPVALAYPDRERMLAMSARISGMTHWDPQAEVCCAAYCLWVRHLLAGAPMGEAWGQALAESRAVAQQGARTDDTPGTAPLPPGFWERLEAIPSLRYEQLQPSGYAGYVVECLEAAVWCCLCGDSLETILVDVVNLAGESDTIAAVAGGAAGACYGASAIPQRWIEKLYQRERLEQVSERLSAFREREMRSDGQAEPL